MRPVHRIPLQRGYQEGSIESRVILNQKGGNVSIFAFDTNQELSEHTAPFDAVVNVLEGKVEVSISGKPCGWRLVRR